MDLQLVNTTYFWIQSIIPFLLYIMVQCPRIIFAIGFSCIGSLILKTYPYERRSLGILLPEYTFDYQKELTKRIKRYQLAEDGAIQTNLHYILTAKLPRRGGDVVLVLGGIMFCKAGIYISIFPLQCVF